MSEEIDVSETGLIVLFLFLFLFSFLFCVSFESDHSGLGRRPGASLPAFSCEFSVMFDK